MDVPNVAITPPRLPAIQRCSQSGSEVAISGKATYRSSRHMTYPIRAVSAAGHHRPIGQRREKIGSSPPFLRSEKWTSASCKHFPVGQWRVFHELENEIFGLDNIFSEITKPSVDHSLRFAAAVLKMLPLRQRATVAVIPPPSLLAP